jgi:N-acetylglucosaminyl-diphospho-decaprenol L-rhamnosyltransferase
MSATAQVAVVVVTYNSAEVLPGLVSSLEAGMAGTAWHLVVVDNASTDGTLELTERLSPDATVVRAGGNYGYAAGINLGVSVARQGDAILVLNPDVRLQPGCAATLATALAAPGVGVVAPHLEDGSGRLIYSIRREPTLLRTMGDAFLGADRAGRRTALGEVSTNPAAYLVPRTIDWAEGSTLMISRCCWEAVGPWDESFFLYSEETDFALRARDAGYAVRYVPDARAFHLEGESGASAALWPLLVANRWRLYRKRHGPVPSAAFWAALVMREGSRAARGGHTNRAALRVLLSPARLRERPGPHSIGA